MRALLRLSRFAMPLFLAMLALAEMPSASRASNGRFEVDDYFRLQLVTELALSSEGAWLAYAVEVRSLEQNKVIRQVYLSPTEPGAKPTLLKELSDASRLAWIPGAQQLAFIAERSGAAQVFTYDRANGAVHQRTKSKDPVVQFRFAPSGQALAYATRAVTPAAASLFARFRDGDTGVLVDTDTTSSHDFLNPEWNSLVASARTFLWVQASGQNASSIAVPGDVKEFFWASDSHALSVNYVGDDNPPSLLRTHRRSLGIVDLSSGNFRTLVKSYPRLNGQPGKSFYGGEWIPNEEKILIRRVTETDPWVSWSFPEWGVADVSTPLRDDQLSWHLAETYGVDGMTFFPINDLSILVEEPLQGVQSLYVWDAQRMRRSELVAGVDGDSSLFAFSADRSRMVFVNESLTCPPEIYSRIGTEGPTQKLSNLNSSIAQKLKITSVAREVTWTSTDGATVSGWLLEPADPTHRGPWPLVTMVHGGPGFAITNMFGPYFYTWGGVWPYPFDAYAAHGIATFFPNYRGTETYGRPFASPTKIDGEPVDDIVSGIQYLIETGVADPARLGISGQSHGGWLGPLVMTRAKKIFRASSFAEGDGDEVVVYEEMPGQLNREVHDEVNGGSLYDSPQRYLDLSPNLHFAGVSSANLFEAGARSSALLMLALGKASRRVGLPTEVIVYPKTGHNVQIPRLQRESAERNLDWFRFWLKGEEDPDPAKAEQYARWRALRRLQEQNAPKTQATTVN